MGGARWLVEHRPDLMRCDYVINEGGGQFLEHAAGRVYLLESGEKGTAQFRLVVHGEAGHASVPLRRGNAVVAAAAGRRGARGARAAGRRRRVVRGSSSSSSSTTRTCAPACATRRGARGALAELAARDPDLADMIEPLYGFAFSPTIVHSNSVAVNVYPDQGGAQRRLPHAGRATSEDEVEAEVRARSGRRRRGVGARVDRRDPRQRLTVPHAALGRHPHRAAAARARRRAGQQSLRGLHRLQLVPRRVSRGRGLQLRAARRRELRRGDECATTTSTSASSCATWRSRRCSRSVSPWSCSGRPRLGSVAAARRLRGVHCPTFPRRRATPERFAR